MVFNVQLITVIGCARKGVVSHAVVVTSEERCCDVHIVGFRFEGSELSDKPMWVG